MTGSFQSSAGREAGCDRPRGVAVVVLWPVSILSRPGSRLRPSSAGMSERALTSFNPQPAGKPAATTGGGRRRARPGGFNPQPAGKPAATWCPLVGSLPPARFQSSAGREAGCDLVPVGRLTPARAVSILSRPGSRLRPCAHRTIRAGCGVSILSRPGSRLRQHAHHQAHRQTTCFNPQPAGKPAATVAHMVVMLWTLVSILSRPGSRLRLNLMGAGGLEQVFQSSAGREAGCDRLAHVWPWPQVRFNPQPAGKPAATTQREFYEFS